MTWNASLYRSWHAAGAAALVLLCGVWGLAAGQPFGARDSANVGYLLVTGWLAVAAYLVLALYAARKAAHRSGLSPEFRMEVPVARLERAQSALTGLQNRIAAGEVRGRRAILAAARAILRQHGVQRVLRLRVDADPQVLGGARLQVLPREPLGRLAKWMHAHLYYGVAVAFLVWFHGGGRAGSTMGLLLNALSYLVIATGVVGIWLWTFGPTWLTRRERELSTEKAFVLRGHYARKVRELAAELAAGEGAILPAEAAAQLERRHALPAAWRQRLQAAAAEPGAARDLLVLCGQRARVEREWRSLGGLRAAMNAWRLVHVPCSLVLLALVLVHVLTVWYY